MDVAKYIGLFLLKNNFVYLPGLGNLEIMKNPATYDGQQLLPPSHTVSLTPTGSIDDNLANFIATNEQTSISKASNELREFSIQARMDLNEGKEVNIPSIGKFVASGGKIIFITNPGFQKAPSNVPAQLVRKTEEVRKPAPQPTADARPAKVYSGTSVNWGKIVIWALIVAVVASAIFFAIKFIPSNNNADVAPADSLNTQAVPPDSAMQTPGMIDSNAIATDTSAAYRDSMATAAAATPVAANGMLQYKVLLSTYDNLPRAQKRESQLNSFGNKVELVTKDSTMYYVVMPVTSSVADTAMILDSLKKKFNPKGVSIYK